MYLVVVTYTGQEYSPPYDYHDNGAGSWNSSDRTKVEKFTDLTGLEAWIIKNKYAKYEVFTAQSCKIKTELKVTVIPTWTASLLYI